MKNAGLAGAIALCGIGLIMNGWQGQEESAHAHAASSMTSRPAVLDLFEACVEAEPVALFDQVGEAICLGTLLGDPGLTFPTPYWYPVPFGVRPGQQFSPSDLDGDGRIDRVIANPMMFSEAWNGGWQDLTAVAYRWSSYDGGGWEFVDAEGGGGVGGGPPPELSVQTFQMTEQGWSLANRNISFDFTQHIPDPSQDWLVYPALYDVDGDARADLVLQWRNQPCGPGMGADCSVVATWHRNLTGSGGLAGDVNNDGQVNGADLTIVLSDWTG